MSFSQKQMKRQICTPMINILSGSIPLKQHLPFSLNGIYERDVFLGSVSLGPSIDLLRENECYMTRAAPPQFLPQHTD